MSESAQHWSKLEERGSVFGMRILFIIYRLLGRKVLWVALFPVVFYLYLTGKTARQASLSFLNQLHCHHQDKKKASHWEGLKHFCSFADSSFDKIDAWLGLITRQEIVYNDDKIFPSLVERQQGAVFIGSHLGNLEVCRALSQGHHKTKINVLVFTHHAIKFNQILQSINKDVSINLIQVSEMNPGIAIALKEKIELGEMIVIVGDRTSVTVEGKVIYSPFLGKKAPFSQGPFILAALMDCPVYWLFCLKNKGKFNLIFEHVTDNLELPRKKRQETLQKLIDNYAQRLAFYAYKFPYQWFNFYDFWQPTLNYRGYC